MWGAPGPVQSRQEQEGGSGQSLTQQAGTGPPLHPGLVAALPAWSQLYLNSGAADNNFNMSHSYNSLVLVETLPVCV